MWLVAVVGRCVVWCERVKVAVGAALWGVSTVKVTVGAAL